MSRKNFSEELEAVFVQSWYDVCQSRQGSMTTQVEKLQLCLDAVNKCAAQIGVGEVTSDRLKNKLDTLRTKGKMLYADVWVWTSTGALVESNYKHRYSIYSSAMRVISHASHQPCESSAMRVISHASHQPCESSAMRVISCDSPGIRGNTQHIRIHIKASR